jgi:acetyl esterase/lipase
MPLQRWRLESDPVRRLAMHRANLELLMVASRDEDPDAVALHARNVERARFNGKEAARTTRIRDLLGGVVVGGVDAIMWRPRGVQEARPVVLAFHGGAFIVGGPLGAERIAAPLAGDYGICTVSVAYRLAPEHRAPAARDDARRALEALHSLPGVDPSRIVVHGSSAGAALAAGVAMYARDIGHPLALQSLTCPALDSRTPHTADPSHSMAGPSPTLSRASAAAMWEHYLGDLSPWSEDVQYAVPALASDLSGVAPAHITVAEHDVLRDEALDYGRRLGAAGVQTDLDLVPGTVHGFDGLLPDSTVSSAAISRQVAAIVAAVTR